MAPLKREERRTESPPHQMAWHYVTANRHE
jgi:hypothetical protein